MQNVFSTKNFITGEKFQSLADATIMYRENCNAMYFDQNKIISVSKSDISAIKKLKIIFIYTSCIDNFFNETYPLLDNNFILISHNSDYPVEAKHLKFLNEGKIINWYSHNCYCSHEKLICLPLGIANSRWPHGNLNILEKVLKLNSKKKNLVYSNFNPQTNNERNKIKDILTKNKIFTESNNKNFEDYLKCISESNFSVSPAGGAKDCHRIWESLYLGTIPIVKYDTAFEQFKDLPIMFVKDWEEVSLELLNQKKSLFLENINFNKLDFLFWKNKIKQLNF